MALVKEMKAATKENFYLIEPSLRTDSSETYINAVIERIKRGNLTEKVKAEIRRIMETADKTVRSNIIKAFKETAKVDVYLSEPSGADELEDEWLAQQDSMVDGIVDNFTSKLKTIIADAVIYGEGLVVVEEALEKLYSKTEGAAKFTARDQTSGLFGALTKLRQEDCGIEVYEWLTARDERVREAHAERDGKLFYWDKDEYGEINGRTVYPAPDYHPAMDYNCRCVAVPVIDMELWDISSAIPLGAVSPKMSLEVA